MSSLNGRDFPAPQKPEGIADWEWDLYLEDNPTKHTELRAKYPHLRDKVEAALGWKKDDIADAREIAEQVLGAVRNADEHPLATLIQDFKDTHLLLDIWRRYPDITEEEDAITDTYACQTVSREFARFAWRAGWGARWVRARPAEPLADIHTWVELQWGAGGKINVDWTARQFHDLGVVDGVLDQPWPLIWEQDQPDHPALGKYRKEGNEHHDERMDDRNL